MSQHNPYDEARIPPEGSSHDERIERLEGLVKVLAENLEKLTQESRNATRLRDAALAGVEKSHDDRLDRLADAVRALEERLDLGR